MADPINIVIIGTDKTGAAFKSVSQGMAGIAKSAQGTLAKGLKVAAGAFVGLGAAGVAGLAGISAGIVKMTLDASKVEGVASTFDALAKSINSEAEPAIQLMREATRGMVADADLMQAGNKFMAMGLANTQEEMGKLSLIATQLGSAMGEGPTESMENFALMLANQSIPRLDSFGIASSEVRNRIKELRGVTDDAGMTQAQLDKAMGKSQGSLEKYRKQLMLANLRQGELNENAKKNTRISAQMKIEELTKKIADEEQALAKLGNTTASTGEAIGAMSREEAFMIAVLEQAEITMEKVGEQADTSAASIARIQATVQNTALGIGQKFIPVLREMLVPIADLVGKVGPKLIDWAGEVATWLGDRLPTIIENVSGFFSGIADAVGSLVSAFQSGGFSAIFTVWEDGSSVLSSFLEDLGMSEQLAQIVGMAFGKAHDVIVNITDAIGLLSSAFQRSGFEELFTVWEEGGGVFSIFLEKLGMGEGAATKVSEAIGKIITVVSEFGGKVLSFIGDFVEWKDVLIALGIGIMSIVLPAIAGILISIGAIIAPILLVIGAVALLRTAWEKNFLGIQDIVKDLMTQVKPFIENVISWFQEMLPVAIEKAKGAFEILSGIWETVIQPALAELGSAFAELFGALKDAWTEIAPIFAELGEVIGDAFGGSGKDAIKFSDVIKTVVGIIIVPIKILTAVATILAKQLGAFAARMSSDWEKHGKTFKKILSTILKVLKVVFGTIFKIIGKVLKEIGKLWHKLFGNSELLDSAVKFGKNLVRTFISFLAGVISEVIKFAADTLRKFVALFSSIIADAIAFGKDLIREFVRFLGQVISDVIAWARNLIREFISAFLDVISAAIQFGRDLIREFIDFLGDIISKIVTWARDLISEFASAFSDVISSVIQFGLDLISEFVSFLAGIISSVVSWATELVSSFTSAFADVISEVIAWGSEMISNFVAVLGDIISEIISWGSELHQTFKEQLEALANVPAEIADLLKRIGADIIEFVLQGIQAVADFASRIVTQLTEWFNQVYANILSGFQAAIDIGKLIVARILLGFNTIVDFAGNIIDSITDWLNDVIRFGTKIWSMAKDIGENIINQILEGFGNMKDDFIDWIRTKLEEWLGSIFSPIPIAQHMGQTIAEQILLGFGQQRGAFTSALRNNLAAWMADVGTGGLAIGVNAGVTGLGGGAGGVAAAAGGNTTNFGGVTFAPVINTEMEEEEFMFKVQTALRNLS